MKEIIHPGAAILFMKVGTHAQEPIEDIIQRKSQEIEDTGYAMWGYGGNTCHPSSMVQPFAEMFEERREPIHLVMEPMVSKHFAEPLRASEYSVDNIKWEPIPQTINVVGSRYALVIRNLRREEFILPLAQTKVAVGKTTGRLGSRYIKGLVDKACFVVTEKPELTNDDEGLEGRKIGYVAELVKPYAVFLRDHR